ncbi:MAG: FAD-dependent oxidoreductase [Oscillospiraceae bacterium]|nr:FAD-dependent oxidoreductase [Oscillospiraceae bacterium]
MKNSLKIGTCFVCLILLAALCGCALTGSATGSAEGYNGTLVLRAERDGDNFVLTVKKSVETAGIGSLALDRLLADMNERQSLAPDVVSGATQTSAAAVEAATKAVKALGMDAQALAERVNFNEVLEKEYDCDVLVIGAGGAGLTTAIAAAERGAKVIVLEKMGVAGGSTARSDGKIMAAGTSVQKDALIVDSSSSLGSFLFSYAYDDADSTRVLDLAQHTAANLDLLTKLGVRFSQKLLATYPGQEPTRVHLVTSSDGSAGGGYLIEPLLRAANAYGVTILYETQAVELLSTAAFTVTGARARETGGSIVNVHADATVLATGGYDRDAELFFSLAGADTEKAVSMTALGSTGDGVGLAKSVGGAVIDGAPIATLKDYYADTDGSCGLLVTPKGARFCNEDARDFTVSGRLFEAGGGYAYAVFDAKSATGKVKSAAANGYVYEADTLEALASALGAPALVSTVDSYNKLCAAGEDTQFGKSASYLKAIETGPFYAVPYLPTVYGTTGGLLTNISCAVVQADGDAIEGMYAAGELINGVYFDEEFPGFGASLAQVIETGRLAGEHAASYAGSVQAKRAAQQLENEANEEAPLEEAKYKGYY